MSTEKDIYEYVCSSVKTKNTIYEPTVGDIMCFYTPHGVHGPIPFEPHAYYATISTQSKIANSNLLEAANHCIHQIQEKLDSAKILVANASNNDISFVHIRFFSVRSRVCRSYLLVSVDVCIACAYQHRGILDKILELD